MIEKNNTLKTTTVLKQTEATSTKQSETISPLLYSTTPVGTTLTQTVTDSATALTMSTTPSEQTTIKESGTTSPLPKSTTPILTTVIQTN
uniref:Integumentary mucin C.1-like n=1 Tax=Denticeps clupeoides TaxID=299321 RepID=A0AAY4DFM5_9TELE